MRHTSFLSRRLPLTLALATALLANVACGSSLPEEDPVEDEGALTLGSSLSSPIAAGHYDLPNAALSIRVGRLFDRQVVTTNARPIGCSAVAVDVSEATARASNTDPKCQLELALSASGQDLVARGSVNHVMPSGTARAVVDGRLVKRKPNALVGRYETTSGTPLTVSSNTDDELQFTVELPTGRVSATARVYGADAWVSRAVIGDQALSTFYDWRPTESCLVVIGEGRTASGDFKLTFAPHASCPKDFDLGIARRVAAP